jgi:hypothetical protein
VHPPEQGERRSLEYAVRRLGFRPKLAAKKTQASLCGGYIWGYLIQLNIQTIYNELLEARFESLTAIESITWMILDCRHLQFVQIMTMKKSG